MALIVSLLGGESTGKTTLAQALERHLDVACQMRTSLVPEHLRHWCASRGRTPEASEQQSLANEQARQIHVAAQSPGVRVVIADTSALMIAAYSELYFQDLSLYPDALAEQRRYGLTLLMGLDLPWQADGLFRDSPAVREATDAALRRSLHQASIPFQTLYGPPDARLQQALRCIGRQVNEPLTTEDPSRTQARRPWSCENCSDPDCEHRLFTGLLRQRPPTEAP